MPHFPIEYGSAINFFIKNFFKYHCLSCQLYPIAIFHLDFPSLILNRKNIKLSTIQ